MQKAFIFLFFIESFFFSSLSLCKVLTFHCYKKQIIIKNNEIEYVFELLVKTWISNKYLESYNTEDETKATSSISMKWQLFCK